MKLIIGLGNPGKEYEKTKHNAGFIILEKIQEKLEFPEFKMEKKFEAEISEGKIRKTKFILVKPQTFMNLSGQAVKNISSFYKVFPENIFLIHDDLDIEIGKMKISPDSSAGGHNGVQSIFTQLGTQKITRYRIGIEGSEKKCERKISGKDFVMQNFSSEETAMLDKLSDEIIESLKK